MQLISAPESTVQTGDNILFDSVIVNTSRLITYEPLTGVFTIRRAGNYIVNWSVATKDCSNGGNVAFAVRVNDVNHSRITSPVNTGEISGTALVETTTAFTTLSLANVTGNAVTLTPTAVQANIVITRQ